jgi:hypothetical protein
MATVERGPSLNLLDYIEPIRDSPLYNSWREPIPPEWFSANRRAFTLVDQDALYGSLLYSRQYGRTASETLDAISDAAVIADIGKIRFGVDSLAEPAEGVSTYGREFSRSGLDTLDATVDAGRSITNQGALVKPMIDEIS